MGGRAMSKDLPVGTSAAHKAVEPPDRPPLERLIAGLIRDYIANEGPVVVVDVAELADAISNPIAAATGLDRSRVVTVLCGAVRSVIDAHGPVSDAGRAAAAAKRVVIQFRADGLWRSNRA